MTRALWVWGPAACLMAVIFALSSRSELPALPGGMSDLTAHGIAYAALAVLMVRGRADARWSGVTTRAVVGVVAVTVLYGVTDEYHQSFVTGRFAEARDLMADVVGACSGAGVVWAWSIVMSAADRRSRNGI